MIPAYPRFKRLELADRRDIESILRRFDPYSDYRFPSLWSWDVDGTCLISMLHGNLVVRFEDYLDETPHYGFLGVGEVRATVRTLLAASRAEGLAPRLRLIPGATAEADPCLRRAYAVVDDPHNFDYLCSVRGWVQLPGKPYARHRIRIHRCQRLHALDPRPLALADAATRRAVLRLSDRWAENQQGGRDAERERRALERLFELGAAGLRALGLHEGEHLRAFSIWEEAPGGFSIHHFMKADRAYAGASSLLIHARSRLLSEAGISIANVEQDLGLPGLAGFKRSLRPCGYLRKFAIAEHDQPRASVPGATV